MATLNETKVYKKVERTLHGDNTYLTGMGEHGNVFSFAIGTAENPMAKSLSAEENEKRMKDFTETLRRNRTHYYRAKGKYGDAKENSLFIANVNLEQCKHWFGPKMFNQESFIFGRINPETHEVEYSYYEQDGKGNFKETIKKTNIVKPDENNNYSKIAGFAFRIPFFEEALADVSNSLEEDYGWNPEYKSYLLEIVSCERTIPNLWRYACTHLLTEEQEAKRQEELSKSIFDKTLREEIVSLSKN